MMKKRHPTFQTLYMIPCAAMTGEAFVLIQIYHYSLFLYVALLAWFCFGALMMRKVKKYETELGIMFDNAKVKKPKPEKIRIVSRPEAATAVHECHLPGYWERRKKNLLYYGTEIECIECGKRYVFMTSYAGDYWERVPQGEAEVMKVVDPLNPMPR